MEVIPATSTDSEFIESKIVEFNRIQVPFTQEKMHVLKNYVIKKNDTIIAGINACVYCWNILYINPLWTLDKARSGVTCPRP